MNFNELKPPQMRAMQDLLNKAGFSLTAEQIQQIVDIYKSNEVQLTYRDYETPEEAQERSESLKKFLDDMAREPAPPPPPPPPVDPQEFHYDGPAYIRPIGRGVVLETDERPYLNGVIEGLMNDRDGIHINLKVDIVATHTPHPDDGKLFMISLGGDDGDIEGEA
jgi:hypothetical protein